MAVLVATLATLLATFGVAPSAQAASDAPTVTAVDQFWHPVRGAGFTVTFDPPVATGGTIQKYQYSTDAGATWADFSASGSATASNWPTSPANVFRASDGSGALPGAVPIPVSMRVVVGGVAGAASTPVSVTTYAVPSRPTNVSVTAISSHTMTVSYTPSTENGWPYSWDYAYSTDSGTTWRLVTSADRRPNPIVISCPSNDVGVMSPSDPLNDNVCANPNSLVAGQSYGVMLRPVVAYTYNGSRVMGSPSDVLSVTLTTPPNSPTDLVATSLDSAVSVAFTATSAAGQTVTDVEYSTDGGVTWAARTDGGGGASPIVISKRSGETSKSLMKGLAYGIQLRAKSGLSISAPSTTVRGWSQGGNGNLDRAAVIAAYQAEYSHASPKTQYTGNLATCTPGTISDVAKQAQVRRLNFYRSLIGEPPVVYYAGPDRDGDGVGDWEFDAQSNATYTAAAGVLSHLTKSELTTIKNNGYSTKCLGVDVIDPDTANPTAAMRGGRSSNISTGDGTQTIDAYFEDGGVPGAGHRTILMAERLPSIAIGEVPAAALGSGTHGGNAVSVWTSIYSGATNEVELRDSVNGMPYSAWPPAGYVPSNLLPWEWGVQIPGANMSAATVTMTNLTTGQPVSTRINKAGTNAVLCWTVSNCPEGGNVAWEPLDITPQNQDVTYEITVSGITPRTPLNAGDVTGFEYLPSSLTYRVTVMDQRATAATVPSKPLNLKATAGDRSVTLEWDPPFDAGNDIHEGYDILMSSDGGKTFNGHVGGSDTSYTASNIVVIDGLVNGSSYFFKVALDQRQVANPAEAAYSDPVGATPVSSVVFAEPASVVAAPGAAANEINVSWAAPTSPSEPVTGYNIQMTEDGTTWINGGWSTKSCSGLQTSCVLTFGSGYSAMKKFKIQAVYAGGTSAFVGDTRWVKPGVAKVPDAPNISTINGSGRQYVVNFTPPAFDGGVDILKYQYSTDRGTTWVDRTDGSTSNTTMTITKESNSGALISRASSYWIFIRAVNSVGNSSPGYPASGSTAAIGTAPPSAPTGVTYVGTVDSWGDGEITATFTPPTDWGGWTDSGDYSNMQYSTDNGVTWRTRTDSAGSSSPMTITYTSGSGWDYLVAGTTYQVLIRGLGYRWDATSTGVASMVQSVTPGTAGPAALAISPVPMTGMIFNGSSYATTANKSVTLSTTGGSGTGSVTYTATGTGCTVSGTTLWVSAITTCTLTATKAADATTASETSAPVTFSFSAAAQSTLTVSNAALSFAAGQTVSLTSAGGSGTGAVTFAATGTGCSVSGTSLTATQPTTCSVTATKAAQGIYSSASSSAVVFTFDAATQSPLVISNSTLSVPANQSVTLTTSGGSGSGTVSYSVAGTGCAIAADLLSASQVTSCTVTATKAAQGAYASATSTTVTFTFTAATQSALTISNTTLTSPANSTVTLTSTGGTGAGAVTYSVTGTGCSVTTTALTTSQPTTCAVTATKAAAGIYATTSSAIVSFVFTAVAQSTLTVSNVTTSNPATAAVTLTASGGSGTGTVSYSVTGAGCSLTGATLTATAVTTCDVIATKAAQGVYDSATSSAKTFTFTAVAQSTFTISNTTLTSPLDQAISLTTAGGSGSGAVTFAVTGSGCSITADVLSASQTTTCTVTATKVAQGIYASATSAPVSFSFSASAQSALTISNSTLSRAADQTVTLTATGGSGSGAVTFAVTGTGCSLATDVLSASRPTSCSVTATKAASGTYSSISSAVVVFTFTAVAQATLSISNGTMSAPANQSVTLSTTGGSGSGAVSFAVTGTGCSLSGTTLSSTTITSCAVSATKAAQGIYDATTSALATFTFTAAAQSALSISNAITTTSANQSITLSTTGGSGTGGVSYAVTGSGCSLTGATLSATDITSCTVTATKAAQGVFDSATSPIVTFSFTAVAQTPLVVSNATVSNPATTTVTLTTSGGSGAGMVTFTTTGAGCSVAGTSLTVTQPTTCVVTASKDAAGIYTSSASPTKSFTFTAVAQSAFSVSNTTLSSPADQPVTLTSTGGSGTGDVSFTTTGTGCSVSGSTLSASQVTTCTVTATKSAEGVFAAATSAPKSFTFTAVAQSALSIANGTLTVPANQTILLSSTGGSGTGSVAYSVTGTGCSLTGIVLSVNAVTSCAVTASKAASGVFASITSAPVSFTFTAAAQSPFAISNATLTAPVSQTIALTTAGGSGPGAVTYQVTGTGCAVTGSTMSATTAATCAVTATKAAGAVYASATSAPVTFSFTALTTPTATATPTPTASVPPGTVTTVTLSKSTLALAYPATSKLVATVAPATATNKALTWTSDNPGVATVSTSGTVTAVSTGTAIIKATASNGVFGSTTVNVVVFATSVQLDSTPIEVWGAGSTQQLSATVLPDNATNQSITWRSSSTSVATVNAAGLVTAIGPGTTSITAVSGDGKVSASVIVTVKIPVTGVTLSKSTLALNPNGTTKLTAATLPSNATIKSVTWSSSDDAIATVTDTGLVTARANGSATITAMTTQGNFISSAVVTVTTKVTGVGVTAPTTTLSGIDSTVQLGATISPVTASNQNVTWSSSATRVATVDANGVVTAVGAGTAAITVRTVDGFKSASIRVTVTVPVSSVTVKSDNVTVRVGRTLGVSSSVTVVPTTASNRSVRWESSDLSVATVSSTGTITGKTVGTATITVTSVADPTKTATITVTVTP